MWILGATARSLAGAPPIPRDYYEDPVKVSDTLKLIAVTAGGEHTCALSIDGDTYCWGSGRHEQLGRAELPETCGNGTFPCSATPVRLEGAPRFTALAASRGGTCGLDRAGAAHCWGYGLAGRGEDSLPAGSAVPLPVPGDHVFVSLHSSPAGDRTCGLTPEGEVICWAPSLDGTGGGASAAFTGPERVATDVRFAAIGYGTAHGCGIDASRTVYCWGDNRFGQLGVGASALAGGMAASVAPIEVQGGLRLDVVAVGPSYSCGIDAGRFVYCFGLGFPLETPGPPDRQTLAHGALPLQIRVPSASFTALAASTTQACLLSAEGDAFCFSTSPTVRPAARRAERVESDEPFVALAVGGSHACAIGADAFAYCWGMSNVRQVGR